MVYLKIDVHGTVCIQIISHFRGFTTLEFNDNIGPFSTSILARTHQPSIPNQPQQFSITAMSSSSSVSGSDTEGKIHVESLVAGRQRRANAGSRMATLLATEEPVETQDDEDDDLKLLFEENAEEEDAEFASGDEAVSDVEMGSSSDEDEGKEEGEDAGEKEIQRQAKEDRKRKRKALEAFATNKKRKILGIKTNGVVKSSSTATASPRLKKKSERVSWLPIQDDRSTRASSRKQTVLNKQIVHERMKESEKKRRELLQAMDAAAKRKEAEKSEALTQEDRLAEAAQIEAQNAKTLNRWEAAEERRVEEQRAKLAALKSRGLQGPVIRIWSGPSKWVDGKCVGIGKEVLKATENEEKAPREKTSPLLVSRPKPGATTMSTSSPAVTGAITVLPAITLSVPEILQSHRGSWASPAPDNPFYVRSDSSRPTIPAIPSNPTMPPEIQQVEIQSKTLVMLDEEALNEPSVKHGILVRGRKSNIKIHGKLPEKERCLITGMYARYRDPKTGAPYANVAAFKQLRANESLGTYTNGRWSTLLGQYVGSDMDAPAALPERLRKSVII